MRSVTAREATARSTTANTKTTVKGRKKEIGEGLLRAMLKQLGLSKKDIEEEGAVMRATLFAYPVKLVKGKDGRYLVTFPDIPEALTDGATEEEALREAADCLSEALMSRIADKQDVPLPSEVKRGQYQIAAEPTVALKAALYTINREKGITAAEMARRLGVDHKEVRRLLDPHHTSKLPRLKEALASVGYEVAIAVHDASKRERL